MLGYGDTEKPGDIECYTIKSLCDDMAALLDSLNVDKAVSAYYKRGILGPELCQ